MRGKSHGGGGRRDRTLNFLCGGLNRKEAYLREQASECLLRVPCRDETERSTREGLLLSHVGRSTEDFAMRLLVTCAGEKTTSKLIRLLDAEDADRAVCSAWVLVQLPDPSTRRKAIRRLATQPRCVTRHSAASAAISQERESRSVHAQQSCARGEFRSLLFTRGF